MLSDVSNQIYSWLKSELLITGVCFPALSNHIATQEAKTSDYNYGLSRSLSLFVLVCPTQRQHKK